MVQNKNRLNQNRENIDEEIDLIALAKTLWTSRKKILKTTLIFMGIGLFIAVFSKNEYTAETSFIPQSSDGVKIGGSLSGLAAMAGINLGSIGGDPSISPMLYPQIFNSISFQKELLQTSLTIEKQKEKVTLYNYYTNVYSPGLLGYLKKYTIGLFGEIKKLLKGSAKVDSSKEYGILLQSSTEEIRLIERMSLQILLDVNDIDGFISISTTMPEPLAAAELAQSTLELLQRYIIDFKILKSTEQLKFIEERYKEKELVFKEVQKQLAQFRDQNKNMNTALAQTALEGLQSEYDLTYGIYTELAKQLEAKKIQVMEDTPVFTVIKPVLIPVEKSKPIRSLVLLIWTIFGFCFGIGLVFGKNILISLHEKWNQN